MCGIAGFTGPPTYANQRIEQMLYTLRHRGPDDQGIYCDDNITLGHQRLSIIDVSPKGHQPYLLGDRYVLVYNGELYNYPELRRELEEEHGAVFSSNSDTEVLLWSYQVYGQECLQHFNGMWAFAIYDRKEKSLFCARDPYGIKPFYYRQKDGRFWFASEIKALLEENEHPYANIDRLRDFLVMGLLDETRETLFKDIYQLRPGEALQVDLCSNKVTCWNWFEPRMQLGRKQSFAQAADAFRDQFQSAVRRHLLSDVPVGFCLSGGLDSSAIVCQAALERDSKELTCISAISDIPDYDESEYIDAVLQKTGASTAKVCLKPDQLLQQLDELIWYMDEPFGSTSIYAQRMVFQQAAQKNLKVMLDGQGADEQLAGYSPSFPVILSNYLRRGRWIRFLKECCCIAQTKTASLPFVAREAVFYAIFPQGVLDWLRKKTSLRGMSNIFRTEQIERFWQNAESIPVKDPAEYFWFCIRHGMQALLHYEDRNSMAVSVESRVPFLDSELVDTIAGFLPEYRFRNGKSKAVMREGLRYVLPEKIRTRYNKIGFATPEEIWIKKEFNTFRNEFEKACDCLSLMINKKAALDWFDKNAENLPHGNFIPWRIICTAHWAKKFHVQIQEFGN